MGLLIRVKPPRLADFGSDQQARKIFAGIVGIELARERQRPGAEQVAEQAELRLAAGRRGAALDGERERRSGLFRRRGPGEGAGDRVVAQRGEQLAGDEGPERDNALAFELLPISNASPAAR